MKPTIPAFLESDALATVMTSLFVDTSVETWPFRGPSEMNLAVIRLKLHLFLDCATTSSFLVQQAFGGLKGASEESRSRVESRRGA